MPRGGRGGRTEEGLGGEAGAKERTSSSSLLALFVLAAVVVDVLGVRYLNQAHQACITLVFSFLRWD